MWQTPSRPSDAPAPGGAEPPAGTPWPIAPSDPTPPAGRSHRPLLLAGLGVAVVALVAGLAVVALTGGDGDDRADERPTRSEREAEEDDEPEERFEQVGEAIGEEPDPADAPSDEDPDEPSDDGATWETVPPPGPSSTVPEFAPAPPTEGAPVDLTAEQLDAALLAVEDLPGLAKTDDRPQTSDQLTTADMVLTDDCRALLGGHEARGTRPSFGGAPSAAPRYAARRFAADETTTVEHEIADGAEVTIDEYRELFTTCAAIEWDGGGGGRLRFTVLDEAPALGDQALAIDYVFGDGQTSVQWILWTRDSVLSSVSISAPGGRGEAERHAESGSIEQYALQADTKLAAVIASR